MQDVDALSAMAAPAYRRRLAVEESGRPEMASLVLMQTRAVDA